MNYKHVLIIGCGRSGTLYAAKLLRALGVSCGHQESITQHSEEIPKSLRKPGESSAFAVPFIDQVPDEWYVIHQLRHPLKVVESLIRLNHLPKQSSGSGQQFYAKHAPESLEYDSIYDHALQLWLTWNCMAHVGALKPNYHFHWLDEGLTPWISYCKELGVVWDQRKVEGVSTKTGTVGKPSQLNWDQFDKNLVDKVKTWCKVFCKHV